MPHIFLYFAFFCLLLLSCNSASSEKEKKIGSADSIVRSEVTADNNTPVSVIDSTPPVWDGDYVKRYPNGVIQIKGEYRNGKRDGQWISFYNNGNKWSEGYFKQGLRSGASIVYNIDGSVFYKGQYQNGYKSGKWQFFENGKVIKEVDYTK